MKRKDSTINKVVNAMRGMATQQTGEEITVSREQWNGLCDLLDVVDHDFRMAAEKIIELSERLKERERVFRDN